ncbi:hypothetical protein B0A48_03912 [Cryoendolithus antarcticus]|uniref:Zinc transporter n=1 Tax=Cryoendolithus antarcticus TaxID=1507870 RepID=A0A1V8TH54_9PEZI|nr:hypothetical protein B0A48_03912 [Cryoendolithus antarcticus]
MSFSQPVSQALPTFAQDIEYDHDLDHEHHHDAAVQDMRHNRSGSEAHIPSPIMIHHDYDIVNNLGEPGDMDLLHDDSHAGMFSSNTTSTMLSPKSATFSSVSPGSQWGQWTPATPQTGTSDGGFAPREPSNTGRNPFNFQPQQYAVSPQKTVVGRSSAENLPGKRRGHKYRHSSIHTSHQIFQAPMQRTPLSVPASLPVPTRKEAWWSMTSHQTLRLVWCVCHFLTSAYVQFSASGSLSMTALSRLLLFDAAGATVCVAVDVMSNFEVWQRGSIRHPFGLERADVLAGFGMAVFIAFMGLDVISHGIQHALENLGDHVPHTAHSHARASAGSVDLDCLLAIAVTLISAIGLKNHSRLGRAMRLPLLASWGSILGNPSHFLTLSCSVMLLFLPLFGPATYNTVDIGFSFLIALLMITLGSRLGTSLASMLLMSYKHPSDPSAVRSIIAEIEADPAVSAVDEAKMWQVHYGLCIANIKLRHWPNSGYGDDVLRIRQKITSLIKSRLGGVYGQGRGPRWDVSVQMTAEKD